MTRTVVALFETAAGARAAQNSLAGLGIAPATLRATPALSTTEGQRDTASVIRDLFGELFGTAPSPAPESQAEAWPGSGIVLAVAVPEQVALDAVRDALLDAGAREVDEHLETGIAGTGEERPDALPMRPYEDYEPDYRKDFLARYAPRGLSFDDCAPAYRYGHALAEDPRYQGLDWEAIEPEAQRDWESQYPESTWVGFKEAIRHGWERAAGK